MAIFLGFGSQMILTLCMDRNVHIGCVPEVIKEGRATMVSAFASFKFGVSFCFTQLIAVLIVFWVSFYLIIGKLIFMGDCLNESKFLGLPASLKIRVTGIERVLPMGDDQLRKIRESYWINQYDSVSYGANTRD